MLGERHQFKVCSQVLGIAAYVKKKLDEAKPDKLRQVISQTRVGAARPL